MFSKSLETFLDQNHGKKIVFNDFVALNDIAQLRSRFENQ